MEPQVASRRPVIGPLITFSKRVVRKLIRWYVSPQVRSTQEQLADQARRNQQVSDQLREQGERLEQALQRIDELQAWALDELGRLHDVLAEVESSRVRLQAGEVSQWGHLQGQLDQLRAVVAAAGELRLKSTPV
jgi:DNA repair exonuclease SbcCD ATPase subunit